MAGTRRRLLRSVGSVGAAASLCWSYLAGPSLQRVLDSAGAKRVWSRHVSIHPRWYWGGDKSLEESRRDMRDWLDMAARSNVNVLHAWIESPGAAALLGEPRYADRYGFWDPARWDAMGELVNEAAERGLSVHLWYSFTRYKRYRNWVPEYDPDLSVLPPGDPGWASLRKSEYERGYTDAGNPHVTGASLCTNEFDAHDWTMELLGRLFDRYPGLNGLKIEEPGYLAPDRCVCGRCRTVYADRYDEPGETLLDHVYRTTEPYYADDRAVAVKTRGTDAFVRRLSEWWESSGPSDALCYSGSWNAKWDRVRGRNWAAWSERGLVPYYVPQAYASSVAAFESKLRGALDAVSDSAVIPGIGIDWSYGRNPAEQVVAQLEAVADFDDGTGTPVAGAGLFSGRAMTPELVRALRTGPYATQTTSPWEH